ncbi:MAG: helicase-associated domain-containing protein [Deltaproteobacteria bacterium]|nr:helicase-associated domain-containing protein [Deltaproteobacteria bacterium]
MDLAGFFRSLPAEILVQYRDRYEAEGETAGKDALASVDLVALADRMTGLLGDRHFVRGVLKSMDRSHHVALVALLQCRGVAGGTWLLQELTQAHGMSEDVWAEVLHRLGADLLVFGNSRQSPPLFYIIPAPIARELSHHFRKRIGLTASKEEGGIRLSKDTNYRHPVGFSLVSLLTYIRQNRIRVTRKNEIFKKSYEDMLTFFGALWGESGEEKVLQWHLDMLSELGLTQQRGGFLEADDLALREFLSMGPRQRRDLYLMSFLSREPLLGWMLDAVSDVPDDGWVPLTRLRTLYRRRYMGNVFHRRYVRKTYYLPPSGFYDPNPPLEILQLAGLLESGLATGGSHVRLSEAGKVFVAGEGFERLESNESIKFLLQPTFDVLAPVGLPLQLLWKLGEVAELRKADRASTYTLTRESVRGALDEGWRAADVEAFLAEGSAVGLPQNVESTVRDWVGQHGEFEFHDALVVTAKEGREKALLKLLKAKKISFEALGARAFAIPREEREQLLDALRGKGLEPAPKVRTHDLSDDPSRSEGALHVLLAESNPVLGEEEEDAVFPARSLVSLAAPAAEGGTEVMRARGSRSGRTGANRIGADLSVKPAAAGAGDLLRLSPGKTMSVIKAAIRLGLDLEVLYPSTGKDDPGGLARVTPKKVREEGGGSWFEGLNQRMEADMRFHIKRIQGIRLAN